MKKAVVVVVAVFLAGCIQQSEKRVFTMNMNEVLQDMEYNISGQNYYSGFKSMNAGDTLIIKDTIANMTYNDFYNGTMVIFSSNSSRGLIFQGNITGKFHIGDNVTVKLHIMEDKFDYDYQGQTWNIDIEYYEEAWDKTNHTQKYIPLDAMTL